MFMLTVLAFMVKAKSRWHFSLDRGTFTSSAFQCSAQAQ